MGRQLGCILNKKLNIIILAAGKGIRMCSTLPKVMHLVGGKPILWHVFSAVMQLYAKRIYIVCNLDNKYFSDQFSKYSSLIHWVVQSYQLGTGHAVQQVLPLLVDEEEVMVLCGDIPLITVNTLNSLLSSFISNNKKKNIGIGLLTATLTNPKGYGRIVRNCSGQVMKIVEDKDIIDRQYDNFNEVNAGILISHVSNLKRWLNKITLNNLHNEYYLTDVVNIAWHEGYIINTIEPHNVNEIKGINNKLQLAEIERLYQIRQSKRLSLSGVIFADINRFDLRGNLSHGQDVYIDINVVIEGDVILGDRVVVGVGCILKNSVIGDDVKIFPYTIIEGAKIDINSTVGPFARLRSGSVLKEFSQIGNFVEVKNTHFGQASKAKHFSYIGDADVGKMVNIGAGTITCNYDGTNKYRTTICDKAFIGSDTQLVAPVVIGEGAIVGAGTTVTQDVSEGETVISRIRQFVIKGKK